MQFNERIKSLRERENLTQKEMADILAISKSTYVKYERGEREPRYGTLVALSQYFDVTTDYILGKSDEENPHIERINELGSFINSNEFIAAQGENLKNVQKMIADLEQIIYLTEYDPQRLDILYFLVQTENYLLDLRQQGIHIFNFNRWKQEDPEFAEVVDEPNTEDISTFVETITKIRKLVDDYLKELSTPQYYNNGNVFFSKEIKKYAEVNRVDLIKKFHNDPRYKMR